MLTEEIKNKIIDFAEKRGNLIGKNISIRQSISVNKDNFDRHFTCFSHFEFELDYFGIRMSGQKMIFNGKEFGYEIDSRCLVEIQKFDNEYVFLEKLSDNVYKRSILNFQ